MRFVQEFNDKDKSTIINVIDKMLTTKVKDFFNKM